MRRSIHVVMASVALVACFWSLDDPGFAQSAPSEDAAFSVSQTRGAFADAGYQVGESHTWSWMQPPFTSFRVSDPDTGRVLTVVIYASTSEAAIARVEAEHGQLLDHSGIDGPWLVRGFGPSVWNGNVALVQSTESHLKRVGSNNGMYDNPASLQEPVADAVDLDFQQALIKRANL